MRVRYSGEVRRKRGGAGDMARRLDVTGADGVRLTAWDYTPGPTATGDGTTGRDAPGRSVTAQAAGGGTALPGIVPQPGPAQGAVPRPSGRPAPEAHRAPAPGVLLLHGL